MFPLSAGAASGRPLRVLHVITSLLRGGAETTLTRLLGNLDRGSVESRVVSLGPRGPVADDIEALGFRIDFLRMGGGMPALAGISAFMRAVGAFRPDVIQGWMYHANLAASAGALRLRGRVRTIWGIRQSVSRTMSDEKPSTRRVIRIGARLSRFPTALVYNSHAALKAHTVHGYFPGRARIVPNGFDLERFRPDPRARARIRGELGIPPEARVIGLLGRYHPIKDHEGFLEAARLARAAGLQAHFLLAGRETEGTNPELAGLVRAKGLAGSVSLLGERRDVPAMIASMDILASASRSEAFSNVIGEAMACGVPCAVTDVGDSAVLVGDAGEVVPAADPAAMAAAWARMLALGPTGLSGLGARARARIGAEYSVRAMADRYSALYSELNAGLFPGKG